VFIERLAGGLVRQRKKKRKSDSVDDWPNKQTNKADVALPYWGNLQTTGLKEMNSQIKCEPLS